MIPRDPPRLDRQQQSRLGQGAILAERYEVIERIASGGCGEVYKVRSAVLDRICAAKILKVDQTDGSDLLRFQQEAKILSLLRHPNIVSVDALAVDQNYGPVLVMEYLGGVTLAQLIEDGLSLKEKLSFFEQLCDGLSFVHSGGILHRDIKPNNVIVTDGRAVLIDFGISKREGDYKKLTATNVFLGTPGYMSPEYCRGELIDQRSDIYAMGCLLYELISGSPPFDGDTPLAVMSQHIVAVPPPLSGTPEVERLYQVVARSLSKVPNDRYQSITELKADLSKALAGEALAPHVVPVVAGKVVKRSVGGFILAVCVAVVVLVVFCSRSSKEEKQAPQFPGTTAEFFNAIDDAIRLKDLKRSQELVDRFCQFVPGEHMEPQRQSNVLAQAWLKQARGMQAQRRFEEAESMFVKSANLFKEGRDPANQSTVHEEAAVLNRVRGRSDLAQLHLEQVVQLKPVRHPGFNRSSLAEIYMNQGNYDKAEEQLKEIITVPRFDREARLDLAEISFRRKQFRKSAERYVAIMKEWSDEPLDNLSLARLTVSCSKSGQKKQAAVYWKEVTERVPHLKSVESDASAPKKLHPNSKNELGQILSQYAP